MQFQSSLARLAAFAFFLLSFSMLVCAAPAPGAGSLAVRDSSLTARDSSLVARTDYTNECKNLLLDLEVKVKAEVDHLVTCSKKTGCDVKPLIAKIVLLIQVFVDKIRAQIKLGATVDVSVCIDIWIRIVLYLLAQLKLCVGLTVDLCAQLNVVLGLFIQLCLDLCVDVVLKLAIQLKLKLAVTAYVDICLKLGLNLILSILGLLSL
ncbi:hypothetical protein FRC09_015301 [Ceratobasidium sp. 395]|nr:hypothetical protein FRC09_015301 [Ceratobasidium sp. 395]